MVKKVHLVTGKGGVGKSLFSATLAHYFSTQNQKTLLTELNEYSFFKDYLGLNEIGYKPRPLKNNLDICQWSPDECLKEYCLHLLKIESLYKLFLENPVSKSLIQIAPGLQELALLGKLTSSPRQHGPAMSYEQIVVDSFSTGHFLGLLRAPSALNEAVPFGAMGEQSKSINDWIRNPDFTQVHIVTLAEELPLTESLQLHQQLKTEFNIDAKMYLNKISGLTDKDLLDIKNPEAKDSLENILELEKWARFELKKSKINFIELELIASLDSKKIINTLLEKYAQNF